MITFILNEVEINTTRHPGMLILDFIRYHQQLTGTKIGCREGDCGACTILVGEIKNEQLVYSSATSCLMAIGNVHGKHIVTIEGINIAGLNMIQQAFADEGATQCGFCTPGFIVSLAGFCMSHATPSYNNAIDSVNGNICRCTGYKSIERAAKNICITMALRHNEEALQFAVEKKVIPEYFLSIKERLQKLNTIISPVKAHPSISRFLGGGTDLYVQQHDTMMNESLSLLYDDKNLKGIHQKGNVCEMGGAVTVADIAASPIFRQYFPALKKYVELVSSTQIRNMATVAGNFTNASPIGDLTIIFLALNAQLVLTNGKNKREVPLRSFYKGYKQLDKSPDELIEKIYFELPLPNSLFNFEKVSKRTHLDIASVNTAVQIYTDGETIIAASLSAGGVGPVPAYLPVSSSFLTGKKVTEEIIVQLLQIVQQEITPISDARGTSAYKRLLLTQLIKAHFITFFPRLSIKKILQHG